MPGPAGKAKAKDDGACSSGEDALLAQLRALPEGRQKKLVQKLLGPG